MSNEIRYGAVAGDGEIIVSEAEYKEYMEMQRRIVRLMEQDEHHNQLATEYFANWQAALEKAALLDQLAHEGLLAQRWQAEYDALAAKEEK